MKKKNKWLNFDRWQTQLLWIGIFGFFWNWGSFIPLTGDQKTYLSIALEMNQNHHFLIPYLFGEPTFLKPPIQYWGTLLGWSLFGLNNFGSYFMNIVLMLLTSYGLVRIHQRLSIKKQSISYAPLWFVISAGTFTYVHSAQMEIYLVCFYTMSWFLALEYMRSKKPKYIYFALALVGLCAWIKSPLYSVLWVLSFLLFLVFQNKKWVFRKKEPYLSLLAGTFIGLVWFGIAYLIEPDRFWNQYVITETFEKKGTHAPIWRLWYDFASFLLPYLVLWIGAFSVSFRSTLLTKGQKDFLFAWILLPAIFFSLFPYKTETYLFLLIPAFSLWMDWACNRILLRHHIPYRFWMSGIINGLVVVIAVPTLALILLRAEFLPSWIGWSVITLSVYSGYSLMKLRIKPFLIASLCILFFVKAGIYTMSEKEMAPLRNYLNENKIENLSFLDPGRNIWHEIGLTSVAVRRPIQRTLNINQSIQAIQKNRALLVSEYDLSVMKADPKFPKKIKQFTWIRWQRRGQFPAKDLLLYGKDRIPNWSARFERNFYLIHK